MSSTRSNIMTEETSTSGQKRNPPPLSSLRNPTFDFLHSNYNKSELQKFGSKLKLKGIWTTKEKVIEKLMIHFSSLNRPPTSPRISTAEDSREKENEGILTDLIERFEIFIRETNDNFYVVNNSLADKEREINELKTKLFLAEETIRRLQEERGNEEHDRNKEVSAEKKTLLIGDSNLQEIRNTDLQDDVIVRTLPATNVAMMGSWIEEKLSHPLKECVIYCGMQDLLEKESTLEETSKELESLVVDLKSKFEGIRIKICELVPSLKSVELNVKINQFNVKVEELCESNEVVFVKTNDYFKLGTGDIDQFCYENIDELTYDNLNRVGAIRLLDAISSKCEYNFVCNDWRVVKQKTFGNSNSRKSPTQNDNRNENNAIGSYIVNRRRSTYHNVNYYSSQGEDKRIGRVRSLNDRGEQGRENSRLNHIQNYNAATNRNRTGCYNCGEFNHVQSNCRYDHMIKCNVCHGYGHKSKLCSNYCY